MDETAALNPAPVEQDVPVNTFIPTPGGMACAYLSLMVMALTPIYFGSFISVIRVKEAQKTCRETGEQAERMTMKDAMMFPLIASCALFGFYVLIKMNPGLVDVLVSGYFFLLGIFAICRPIKPFTHMIFPKKYNSTQYTLLFTSKDLTHDDERTDQNTDESNDSACPTPSDSTTETEQTLSEVMIHSMFTPSDILAFLLAVAFSCWYVYSKHWVANNIFALAFAFNGIELLPIDSVAIGCMLLGGLLFYDVFWVFGTSVMVSVAKNFNAPIKLLFPQDFLLNGLWGKHFAMLGLGDIVIPGIFIAMLLRFDAKSGKKHNVYFWSGFLAYTFGLGLTIGVMSYFKHAQPALLYLVPACIIIPLTVAVINGDLRALLAYRDHPIEEEASDADSPEADGDSVDRDSADELKDKKPKNTRSIRTRAAKKND